MFSRRKPPKLTLYEELQHTYYDCYNLSLKYLKWEEDNKLEESLKGWKSLHTTLLFKLDSFEKVGKFKPDEETLLNDLKELKLQNSKHLLRAQLKMDEINRVKCLSKQTSSTPLQNSSTGAVRSLRAEGASKSLTNSNQPPRSMLKSLRSKSNSSKSNKVIPNGNNQEASKAATTIWQKPKPNRSNNNSSGELLFDDFNQETAIFDNNWEKIRDTPSPPNLIELDERDDYFANGNKLGHSLEDLTIKVVPVVSKKQSASSLRPPNFEHASKSTPDIHQEKRKAYSYSKPKPMDISHLMKKSHQHPSSKKPASSPRKVINHTQAPQSKSKTATVVPKKKSNISYNYVTNPSKNPKKSVASIKPKSIPTVQDDIPQSPTMDDILDAYDDVIDSAAAENPNDVGNLTEKELEQFIASVRGADPTAAKQILNDIVVHGDEVHWDDIVGLEGAKNSLKEAVVYPFLRPDLFKGLREPTRGMLLFGPPGTGKTMLARAVATESKSTFFSISSSSLTSKYLGESEKLVKTLFLLARRLSPSIVFIDEIDSLLSSRSENEIESSRRIKNEFLVQWSELSSAAAGKDREEQDDRVLILGATNLPWSIDEAARRRFVKRQYIPLPEDETRMHQIMKLLKYQKNTLSKEDYETLIQLTKGFSGSDITALAKDSAMGPLRSLGDKLLSTDTESIRPINLGDFRNSLIYIRPSVSSEGLEEYEKWATKFGSSGV